MQYGQEWVQKKGELQKQSIYEKNQSIGRCFLFENTDHLRGCFKNLFLQSKDNS